MANNKILSIVVVVLVFVIIGAGLFYFLGNKGTQKETNNNQQTNTPVVEQTPSVDKMAMVNCGTGTDPFCFLNRMNECLPVTIQMMGGDNTTKIEMTILGIEDGKCHFQRKINDVLNLNCFFPKGTMNQDTLDQTFGNDKGLQKVVDDACKSGW